MKGGKRYKQENIKRYFSNHVDHHQCFWINSSFHSILLTSCFMYSLVCSTFPTTSAILSLKRDRFTLGYAASSVATSVIILRAIRWMFVGEAKGAPSSNRRMLAHGYVLAGPESNSWSGRTSSWTWLGHRLLSAVIDALGHVTDNPDVTAQLIIRSVLAKRLHFATVHAEIHVSHATTFSVVSCVRMNHLDEICVAAVQTIYVSRT